jgi:hypothetical protein
MFPIALRDSNEVSNMVAAKKCFREGMNFAFSTSSYSSLLSICSWSTPLIASFVSALARGASTADKLYACQEINTETTFFANDVSRRAPEISSPMNGYSEMQKS